MNTSNDIYLTKRNGRIIYFYTLFWSLALLACVPIACIHSGEGINVFYDFYLILISPSNLITDYFNIGGLGSTFLNAALCGLACNLIVICSRAKAQARILAGYFLIIAHCFYGLNLLNMWPTFIGVYVYCKVSRQKFSENVHIAMFSTALAPFVSEFLFRYTVSEFVFGKPQLSAAGIILALVFGIASGFAVPALLPGTTKMHRGFNLYKAGLAIGIFGMLVFALMYQTFGIEVPEAVVRDNLIYNENGGDYALFVNVFFAFMFSASIIIGFLFNEKSFHSCRNLLKSTGHNVDFVENYGAAPSIINVGVVGLFIMLYFNIIFLLPMGLQFTGPTAGVIIAAVTFCASGQTPRNVWPIGLGYVLLSLIASGIAAICELEFQWAVATQGYINSFAFATGLCPFAGKYGWKMGVAAGMINAAICTSTSALHGGFVLYNGGLTAGITAIILLSLLDFYHAKIKHTEKEASL